MKSKKKSNQIIIEIIKLVVIQGLMDLKIINLVVPLLEEVLIIVQCDYRSSHLIRKNKDDWEKWGEIINIIYY